MAPRREQRRHNGDHGREVTLLALRNDRVIAARNAARRAHARHANTRRAAALGVAAGHLQHRAFELDERNQAVFDNRPADPDVVRRTPGLVRSSRTGHRFRAAFNPGTDMAQQIARAAGLAVSAHEQTFATNFIQVARDSGFVVRTTYEDIHNETAPPTHLGTEWHHPRVTGWENRPAE